MGPRYSRRWIAALSGAGILIVAGGLWWSWQTATAPSASITGPPVEKATALSAPRLSIVVLPFVNLSNDPDQQYFVDAVTEDLTTDLSRIEGSFVISRNTAFTYKDKPVNAKQIGRELGVHYVLEGSVQRSGNHIRVNAQLIDPETNAQLWAERFDRDIGDLFAMQNEITSRIAVALNFALVGAEAARPSANPDALDYFFRGRAVLSKSYTPDSFAEAIGLFERALAVDPQSVRFQSFLALALTGRVLDGMSSTATADIARAEDLVGQALAVSPNTALAHTVKGAMLRARRRYADAIPEYEMVIALDRNLPGAYANLGNCKFFTGSLEEVIPLAEQAVRLSPRDPNLGYWYSMIGQVHLLQSRTEEAILWLEKARSANPAHPYARASLASAYGLKGETERAAAELAEARRLVGNPRFSSIARMRAGRNYMAPNVRALFEATYDAGMRKAGVPEE
jgi:TolB-like protein